MTAIPYTVSPDFTAITGLASAECRGCHAAIIVDSDAAIFPLCNACQHDRQDHDAGNIGTLIRSLAAGEWPFGLLSPDDRRVHLSQLATAVAYARLQLAEDDNARSSILAGPVSQEAAQVAHGHYVSTFADEPSPDEREAIYAMEEILDREEVLEDEFAAGSEIR